MPLFLRYDVVVNHYITSIIYRTCSPNEGEALHDNGCNEFVTCFSDTQFVCKAQLKPACLTKSLFVCGKVVYRRDDFFLKLVP